MIRKLIIAALLLIGAVAVAIPFIPREDITRLVVASMSRELSRNGVRVSLTAPELRLIGLSASEAEIFFNRALLGLTATEVEVGVPWGGVLTLSPEVQLNTRMLGGSLTASLRQGPEQSLQGSATFEQLQITRHPQVSFLGLTTGALSGSITELNVPRGQLPSSGSFEISGENFTKPEDSLFAIPSAEGAVPVAIPAFKDLRFTVNGELAPVGRIEVKRLTANCSLAEVQDGSGWIDLGQGRLQLTAGIELSAETVERFGPLLSALTGRAFSNESRQGRLLVDGRLSKPRVTLR